MLQCCLRALRPGQNVFGLSASRRVNSLWFAWTEHAAHVNPFVLAPKVRRQAFHTQVLQKLLASSSPGFGVAAKSTCHRGLQTCGVASAQTTMLDMF